MARNPQRGRPKRHTKKVVRSTSRLSLESRVQSFQLQIRPDENMFPTGTNQVRTREHDLTEESIAKLSEMSMNRDLNQNNLKPPPKNSKRPNLLLAAGADFLPQTWGEDNLIPVFAHINCVQVGPEERLHTVSRLKQ